MPWYAMIEVGCEFDGGLQTRSLVVWDKEGVNIYS